MGQRAIGPPAGPDAGGDHPDGAESAESVGTINVSASLRDGCGPSRLDTATKNTKL